MNSVIRALLYANEMDIAGIVLTSSTYHYAGDPEAELRRFDGREQNGSIISDGSEFLKNLFFR